MYTVGLGLPLRQGVAAPAHKVCQSIQPGFWSMSYSRLRRGGLGQPRRAFERGACCTPLSTNVLEGEPGVGVTALAPGGCSDLSEKGRMGTFSLAAPAEVDASCGRQGLSLPPWDVHTCSVLALVISPPHTRPGCRGGDPGGSFCSLTRSRLDVFCPWALPQAPVWRPFFCRWDLAVVYC